MLSPPITWERGLEGRNLFSEFLSRRHIRTASTSATIYQSPPIALISFSLKISHFNFRIMSRRKNGHWLPANAKIFVMNDVGATVHFDLELFENNKELIKINTT